MDADKQIRDSHPDFVLWRPLRQEGRLVSNAPELSGPGACLSDGNRKPTNPGWKLDIEKFLQLIIPYHRHSDVYADYILPKTQSPRDIRKNYAEDDKGPVEFPDACWALCQADETCLQYMLNGQSTCLTTGRPNSCEPADDMHSGWIPDRMCAFYDTAPDRDKARWITE
ncbi:hypothetical protein LTR95_005089 [Oleoguttula sp. CCFEE 5521]